MWGDVNSDSISYSHSWSVYNSVAGVNGQTKYTSSQYSFTLKVRPYNLRLFFLQAPLSGTISVYINGDLIRSYVVPQSDSYSVYTVDLSSYNSDQICDIVVVNHANSVSSGSYNQSGRCYFAGYNNFESLVDDEAPFIPFTGILLFFALVVSIVIFILR